MSTKTKTTGPTPEAERKLAIHDAATALVHAVEQVGIAQDAFAKIGTQGSAQRVAECRSALALLEALQGKIRDGRV